MFIPTGRIRNGICPCSPETRRFLRSVKAPVNFGFPAAALLLMLALLERLKNSSGTLTPSVSVNSMTWRGLRRGIFLPSFIMSPIAKSHV